METPVIAYVTPRGGVGGSLEMLLKYIIINIMRNNNRPISTNIQAELTGERSKSSARCALLALRRSYERFRVKTL